MREWTAADAARSFRIPTAEDDKYSRGVVALRTGSEEYPGAAVLGVEAAWRTGAGYVRYHGPRRAADAVLARRPETVTLPAGAGIPERAGAWVIGSGTDPARRSREEERALRTLLDGEMPVVADAGALDLVPGARAPLIVTPHAGELMRLRAALGLAEPAGGSRGEGMRGGARVALVAQTARALGHPVLLKGAETLVASSGDTGLDSTAPDSTAPDSTMIAVRDAPGWLAVAGTGDVLAGILGAILAMNPDAPLTHSAATAAWVHARAARRACGLPDAPRDRDRPEDPGHPIVALDVARAVPAVVAELLRRS